MFKFAHHINRLLHLILLLTVTVTGLAISGTAYAKRNPEEAFRYQQHMAQAGYSSAIYKLGVMYQNGYGTRRNLAKALELFEESLALGYKPAESRISEVKLMMESGDFNTPKANANANKKNNEAAQARLKAEREKLQKEKQALERSKQQTQQKRQEELRQRQAEQEKLDADLKRLQAEKEKLETEKRRLKAQKELEKWRTEASAMEEGDY